MTLSGFGESSWGVWLLLNCKQSGQESPGMTTALPYEPLSFGNECDVGVGAWGFIWS